MTAEQIAAEVGANRGAVTERGVSLGGCLTPLRYTNGGAQESAHTREVDDDVRTISAPIHAGKVDRKLRAQQIHANTSVRRDARGTRVWGERSNDLTPEHVGTELVVRDVIPVTRFCRIGLLQSGAWTGNGAVHRAMRQMQTRGHVNVARHGPCEPCRGAEQIWCGIGYFDWWQVADFGTKSSGQRHGETRPAEQCGEGSVLDMSRVTRLCALDRRGRGGNVHPFNREPKWSAIGTNRCRIGGKDDRHVVEGQELGFVAVFRRAALRRRDRAYGSLEREQCRAVSYQ